MCKNLIYNGYINRRLVENFQEEFLENSKKKIEADHWKIKFWENS